MKRKFAIPKQEKRFDYKGFPCVILFMPGAYRCGYVGLSDSTTINIDDIDCHCGITYNSDSLYHQADTDRFWIGFDCAHACDAHDVDTAKKLFADDEYVIKQLELMRDYFEICKKGNQIRTLEYCEEQCKSIVDQILKIQNGENK